jgi:hypothetical protein
MVFEPMPDYRTYHPRRLPAPWRVEQLPDAPSPFSPPKKDKTIIAALQ